MTPIKKIAGEILLYFYWLQRKDRGALHDSVLSFQMRHFSQDRQETGPMLERREQTLFNAIEMNKFNDSDIYNAVRYLKERYLIEFKSSKTTIDDTFLCFEVTAQGVDLIEGIERGDAERKQFNVTFNFNIENNITVDSLLKAELGSLIKASLL